MKKTTVLAVAVLFVSTGFFCGCNEQQAIDANENEILLGRSMTTLEPIYVSNKRSYSMNLSNPYEIAYYGCAEEAKRVLHETMSISYSAIEKYEVPQFIEPKESDTSLGWLNGSYYYRCTTWPRHLPWGVEYKNGTESSGVVSKRTEYNVYGYLWIDNEFGEATAYRWSKYEFTGATAYHKELFNPNNIDIDWSRADLYYPGWEFFVWGESFTSVNN